MFPLNKTRKTRKLQIFSCFQEVENGNIGQKWVNCSCNHCVKCIRTRKFSGPYFPAFGLNTDIFYPVSHIETDGSFALSQMTALCQETRKNFDMYFFETILSPSMVFCTYRRLFILKKMETMTQLNLHHSCPRKH